MRKRDFLKIINLYLDKYVLNSDITPPHTFAVFVLNELSSKQLQLVRYAKSKENIIAMGKKGQNSDSLR